MTRFKNIAGRALATLGVAGLAVAGAAGAAVAAVPEFGSAPGQPDAPADGQLTIHKYVGVDAGFTGNGSEQTITGKTPLAGVTFTAYPITDINLFTWTDWDGLAGLTGTCDPADVPGHTLGTGIDVGPTDATGTASQELAVGAYLVCETDAPASVTDKSAPFIVTIPMPAGNDGWRYQVHAYPKNLLEEGEDVKAIDDGEAVVEGDTITFTVTSKFQNAPVDSFVMWDQIDSRLTYTADSLTVTAVEPDGTETDATGWFNVDYTSGKLTATAKSGADGIDKLNALAAGYKLVFEFDVTVDDGSVGIIENTANVNDKETSTVETKWGNIEITKVDKDKPSTLLDGAEFEIYAGACPADGSNPTGTVLDTLTTVSGVATSVSLKEGTYCVVETKAPAGYAISADNPWTVNVVAGEDSSTVKLKVENAKKEVPGLPITGAAGTLLLTIGGIALLAIGSGLAVTVRNRKVSA